MASRSLNDLLPAVRSKAHAFTSACEKRGITLLIYCTYRSEEEQQALYAQGREPVAVVNTLRRKINLPLLVEVQNKIVTRAKPGYSFHQYRCAFDCAPIESGKPVWDVNHPVWAEVGIIGEKCGFDWAGRWVRFKEFPHFQYTGGLKISDLRLGAKP